MRVHNAEHWAVIEGDCVEALRRFPPNRFDAMVTDPPAGIGFMGKGWDSDKGGRDQWVAWLAGVMHECLRVLKPGAHALVWALPRTSHWTATALENAGFEVRDVVMHLFGTGFPKSLTDKSGMPTGQGTALKPAAEHWILCRKPLAGTVAANVAAHGTGGLNIDACRIGTEGGTSKAGMIGGATVNAYGAGLNTVEFGKPVPGLGRWPANLTLDEGAAAELDTQSGVTKSTAGQKNQYRSASVATGKPNQDDRVVGHSDSGGASRFFYCAKPSTAERDAGCESLPPKSGGEATDRTDGSAGVDNPRAGAGRGGGRRNTHPTVKPIALMRYLIRLITPPGGDVLDPFTGSGTTGVACALEGCGFIGMEQSPDYVPIALARLKAVKP